MHFRFMVKTWSALLVPPAIRLLRNNYFGRDKVQFPELQFQHCTLQGLLVLVRSIRALGSLYAVVTMTGRCDLVFGDTVPLEDYHISMHTSS